MLDFFEGRTLNRIHKWYLDLSKYIRMTTGGKSTAADLLEYYLIPSKQTCNKDVIKKCKEIKGKETGVFGNKFDDTANTFILSDDYIQKLVNITPKGISPYKNTMQNIILPIFLSKSDKNLGILPRLRKNESSKVSFDDLKYYTRIEFPKGTKDDVLKWIMASNPSKLTCQQKDILDVFVGLHKYIVRADVVIDVEIESSKITTVDGNSKSKPNLKSIPVSISSWISSFYDYYDFNKNVGFSLPNPDAAQQDTQDRINPDLKVVPFYMIKHKYLDEMTKVGLAKPFYIYGIYYENNPNLLIKNEEIFL